MLQGRLCQVAPPTHMSQTVKCCHFLFFHDYENMGHFSTSCNIVRQFGGWSLVQYRIAIGNAFQTQISCSIVLILCTKHGSDTDALCVKFQNDWTTQANVMDERDFSRFEFKISFGRILYIAQHPRVKANKGPVVFGQCTMGLNTPKTTTAHWQRYPSHRQRSLTGTVSIAMSLR